MNHKGPKYGVKSIKLKNFKGIQSIEINDLPKNASWIFLTGENGFGKTSILQGIASSLANWESHTILTFNDNTLLQTGLHGIDHIYKIHKSVKINTKRDHKHVFEFLTCYGSSRLDHYEENNSRKIYEEATTSLYDTRTLLENIEYSFIRWFYKEKHKASQQRFKFVKELLINILELKDIEIDYNNEKVYYIEKDKEGSAFERVTYQELASGYRSVITMVGDLIVRLFRTQPEVVNPSDLEGIVIIDELDLHFHPKWQKRLPNLLTKYFPKIQFIVSTHSPIPLLGAPKGSVVCVVRRNAKEGVTMTRIDDKMYLEELLPNTILTSPIFDMEDITNENREKGAFVRTEETFKEVKFADQLRERIDAFIDDDKEQALIDRFKNKR